MIQKEVKRQSKLICKGILKAIDDEGLHIADSPDSKDTECFSLDMLSDYIGKPINLTVTEQTVEKEEIETVADNSDDSE